MVDVLDPYIRVEQYIFCGVYADVVYVIGKVYPEFLFESRAEINGAYMHLFGHLLQSELAGIVALDIFLRAHYVVDAALAGLGHMGDDVIYR